jgi:hypothetical protein
MIGQLRHGCRLPSSRSTVYIRNFGHERRLHFGARCDGPFGLLESSTP